MIDLKQLNKAIVDGDAKKAVEVTKAALAEGTKPLDLIQNQMIPAMDEVGMLFEQEEYFVPELLLSGRAMRGAFDLIRPLMKAQGIQPTGRVAIGSVQGDLHDIGKNLVAAMLEGAGFEVFDLGADVKPEAFVETVKSQNCNFVAMSAMLTVTMPKMLTTIEALKAGGLRDKVKVMVGGAPISQAYCHQIGADVYSETASGAAVAAKEIAARYRRGRANMNELLLILVPAISDSRWEVEGQIEHELESIARSNRAWIEQTAAEGGRGGVGVITETIAGFEHAGIVLGVLAAVAGPVSAVIGAWLHIKSGRKLRLKVGPDGIDIETNSSDEMDKLFKMALQFQKDLITRVVIDR